MPRSLLELFDCAFDLALILFDRASNSEISPRKRCASAQHVGCFNVLSWLFVVSYRDPRTMSRMSHVAAFKPID